MKNLLSYIPPLVAFAAMFVGLLGPSRRSDQTGIRAITLFGWISCAIGAVSLTVAVYLQYKKDVDLAMAAESQQRMRLVVTRELLQDVESLKNVLLYAALMPYLTTAITTPSPPNGTLYTKYAQSRLASDIDLRSPEVVQNLERLYLSPTDRMLAPVVPSAMPFGTHVAKGCMTVLTDESRSASNRIQSGVQKYAAIALAPEIISAASEVVTSPFLNHLTMLRESWENRSEMEDSTSPRSLNFRFLHRPSGSEAEISRHIRYD